MGLPLIKKYEPTSSKDIIGQNEAVYSITKFLTNFKQSKKKALFLWGPSGVGKTLSAICIGDEQYFEIIEVNASDFRNAEKINSVVGNALKQGSIFGKSKLIIIDEVDGLAGQQDRGALSEIVSLIKLAKYPIILTAHNPYDNKFSTLRSNSELIEFKPLGYIDVYSLLKKICDNEKIKYDESSLKSLARMSGGDMRCAVNDLEGLTASYHELRKDDLMGLASRDKEESMLQALVKILKNSDAGVALKAFDNVNADTDEQMLWLDKNIPLEYDNPKDRANAYYYLSRADIFRRRIKRGQHWRFLVYINAFLTAGIATSKEKKYDKLVKYEPTGRLLKIFWANQKAMKKKDISKKIAEKTHQSIKEVMKDFEYYKLMINKYDSLPSYFDFDEEEITWLKK